MADPAAPPPLPPPWHPLHYLPKNASSLLDIGCNAGEALLYAHQLGVKKLLGVEINPAAANEARKRLAHVAECQIVHESADTLPFQSQSIDVALSSEVLEHIPENLRPGVVREAHRVLKENAPWIITVPAKGFFSFLDPANFRLAFPLPFKILSWIIGGRGREAGFENQKHGIVWHHHFRLDEIKSILEPHFTIETVRFRGCLLVPVCNWLQFPFYRRGAYDHFLLKWINAIDGWEMARQCGEFFGYNLLLVVRKK